MTKAELENHRILRASRVRDGAYWAHQAILAGMEGYYSEHVRRVGTTYGSLMACFALGGRLPDDAPGKVAPGEVTFSDNERQIGCVTEWDDRRIAREDRLRSMGFEEPTREQCKANLALNVALREWPKDGL